MEVELLEISLSLEGPEWKWEGEWVARAGALTERGRGRGREREQERMLKAWKDETLGEMGRRGFPGKAWGSWPAALDAIEGADGGEIGWGGQVAGKVGGSESEGLREWMDRHLLEAAEAAYRKAFAGRAKALRMEMRTPKGKELDSDEEAGRALRALWERGELEAEARGAAAPGAKRRL